MQKLIFITLFLFSFAIVFSQDEHSFSIHQQQLEFYNQLKLNQSQLDSMHHFVLRKEKLYEGCSLNKIVFGWFPYWQGTTYYNFEWDLLSDLSYFAYEVNPSTGNANNTHSWATTAVVDSAQAHGVRVNLCVTLFSNHATFFGSSASQQTLIDNLIAAVQQRNANGVNIDFEGVPSSQATNFNNFLVDLSTQMHSQIPGSQVSIALYAVDWSNVFDETVLNNYLDYFIIMGYDYYYGGSSYAGPNDPLYSFTSSGYNLSRSVNYYLNAGISKEKLVLGLPYYGFDWPTTSSTPGASTTASASTKLYNTVMNNTSGYYSNANKHWDNNSMSSFWVYNDGSSWRQCFVDDKTAMAKRLDLINQIGIAGMGIWALGYDDGYTDMWDNIAENFSTCGVVPCSDTIYDNGGPGRDYYDNSDYTYTIAPTGATGLTLSFTALDLEAGYDSLWIYDGNDTNAPLIASLSGSTIPAPVVASGNALTIQFYSDGATVGAGWEAVWQCTQDNQLPTTDIVANDWYPSDFTVLFDDQDNDTVLNRWFTFYLMNNGNSFYSYRDSGYFFESFPISTLDTTWHNIEGNWQINIGDLTQSDETLSNTNLYIDLNQNISQKILYSWDMNIAGSGTNRRAGLHFFSDDATTTNRHNSYMVYFRVDQDKVQIYKYVNDTMFLETDDDCVVDADTWYNCKVVFDKQTGLIEVYQNNYLVSTWTDTNPHILGNYLSLRTGNALVKYDNFMVFVNRDTTHSFAVDNNSWFRIYSIVQDGSKNFSAIVYKDIRIDQTPPQFTGYVNDGNGVDVDSVYVNTEYSANWSTATDSNSYITKYHVALGTQPKTDNIVSWTDNGNITSINLTGLNLQMDTTYYFSVIAENIAGLLSDTLSSDGAIMSVPMDYPIANFTISDTLICKTYSVSFTDYSYDAQTYFWEFQGGTPSTSTQMNPTTTYNDTGIYDVSLIVSNSLGSDTMTILDAIHVVGLPVSDFDVVSQTGQQPFTAYFINNSLNADYYYWLFEMTTGIDSSIMFEPYHIYYDTGCYDVTLIVNNYICEDYRDTLTIPDFICVTTNLFSPDANNVITVFPNPVKDVLYLKFSEEIKGSIDMKVYNATGQCLISQTVEHPVDNYYINTSYLKSGDYIIELSYKGKFFKKKFQKIE